MVFGDTGGWIAVTEVSDSVQKVGETYYLEFSLPARQAATSCEEKTQGTVTEIPKFKPFSRSRTA